MIGRKRSRQAWKIASRGVKSRSRSASSAKSIIMIAFFFTMPISRITPIRAMMLNSVPNSSSASTAPTPAEGSVERMVSGWIEALVEDAEHDVDGDQRGSDQKGLACQRAAGSVCGRAGEPAMDALPACESAVVA